jgi:hypothetical protein
MMQHCHVVPSAPEAQYPYLVLHFDGRGKWAATSYCGSKDQATKQAAAANRRYRNQRRTRKASNSHIGRPAAAQPVLDGANDGCLPEATKPASTAKGNPCSA